MASRNATIAASVKTQLNAAATSAATFGEAFVAKRVYVPVTDLEALRGLTVKIFAAGDDRDQESRGTRIHDITIDVGIQKRLTKASDPAAEEANTEIDGLMELAEKVSDFFVPPFAAGGASLLTAKLTGPYPDHLLEHRVFTAFITLTFKYRAP